MSLLKFLISFDKMYGGFETIKSYFPSLNRFISKTLNFERFNKLSFLQFILAISIAFREISIPIPLEKFRLQIMEISGRNWIVGLETTQEYSHVISEEMCVNRIPVRNRIFLEDWMEATNLRLEYDMFTGNHKRNCSNFKIHDKYFWE